MAVETDKTKKLAELFDDVWKIYIDIDNSDEPTSSTSNQDKICEAIDTTVLLIDRVNQLNLFSTNEDLEEISSLELRYMLLSYLLGFFTIRKLTADRYQIIKQAQLHFIDYLRIAKTYKITETQVPEINEEDETVSTPSTSLPPNSPEELKAMANTRERKIKRFKEMKENEKTLKELHEYVEQEHVDDEVKRKYYTTLLKQSAIRAEEEMESLQAELPILEHMAKMKEKMSAGEKVDTNAEQPKKKGFRPFILTRNEMQSAVFGAGYKNLPTYTVEQWYEMEAAAGRLPKPEEVAAYQAQVNDPNAQAIQAEKEDLEKEAKLEVDDEEELQKARNWDDWKDDNRRGWGNRQNMG